MKTLCHITGIVATAVAVVIAGAGAAHAAEKKTIGLALTGVHPAFAGQAENALRAMRGEIDKTLQGQ